MLATVQPFPSSIQAKKRFQELYFSEGVFASEPRGMR
jgi:hypothetical protein